MQVQGESSPQSPDRDELMKASMYLQRLSAWRVGSDWPLTMLPWHGSFRLEPLICGFAMHFRGGDRYEYRVGHQTSVGLHQAARRRRNSLIFVLQVDMHLTVT